MPSPGRGFPQRAEKGEFWVQMGPRHAVGGKDLFGLGRDHIPPRCNAWTISKRSGAGDRVQKPRNEEIEGVPGGMRGWNS